MGAPLAAPVEPALVEPGLVEPGLVEPAVVAAEFDEDPVELGLRLDEQAATAATIVTAPTPDRTVRLQVK
jgi:hypothetical protein